MKAVLISIQPKWCEKILSGEKTIEVRKTRPKIDTPFKCYIYKTKKRVLRDITHKDEELWGTCGQIAERTEIISCPDFDGGKIIGEFVCRGIMQPYSDLSLMAKQTCLKIEELSKYANGKELFGWRIADLKIYDQPRELSEFYSEGMQGLLRRL